jgi:hypothetical protein
MTTLELIEKASDCDKTYCYACEHYKVDCWGTFDLIEKLRNRLEKAKGDIHKCCPTCKHFSDDDESYCEDCLNPRNEVLTKWQWRGDGE